MAQKLYHHVKLEGMARTFVNRLPADVVCDLTDGSPMHVYMYCWINSERGQGARVHYSPFDIAASPLAIQPETATTIQHHGEFDLALRVQDNDPDLLKIMACMRMTDQETKNPRTVTLAASAVQLDRLLMGEEQKLTMYSQFDPGNYTEVVIRASNAHEFANCASVSQAPPRPLVKLSRSSLWDMDVSDQAVGGVSASMVEKIQKYLMTAPPGGEPFVAGLTSWEFGGAQFHSGAPPIKMLRTHYALMNSQEESLKRPLPIQLVAYHIYLRILHSGMTAEAIMKLDEVAFGRFFAQALQITCDAGLVPYQRDFVPGLAVSMTGGLKVMARGTENMGLPCGANQFLGRTVRALCPIAVPHKATILDLRAVMEASARNVCIGRGLGHVHLTDCGISPGPGPGPDKTTVLTDCCPCILTDDCESSAFLALLCRITALMIPSNPKDLQGSLSMWSHLFKNFTPKCYTLMSQICNRGVGMLRSGVLKVTTGVGIATGASAADIKTNTATYNGHCFNIGRVMTRPPSLVCAGLEGNTSAAEGQAVTCFLLEGTASMDELHVPANSFKIPVQLWQHPGQSAAVETKYLEFPAYLTMLGQAFVNLTQVVNAPNGGRAVGGGWPMSGPPVTGWISSKIFTNSLDSDRSAYLDFYNRVVYTGFECAEAEGRGCMPVQEKAGGFVTGCHPYDLNNAALRAVNAKVSDGHCTVMNNIMNEATPPMVDHSVLQRLSEYWAPCGPLSDVNLKATLMREKGVQYARVSCMETPCIPEFVPFICHAKRIVCDRANQINACRPDTDGVIIVCDEDPNLGTCTGCHCHLDVPCRAHVPTIIHSLRMALKEKNYPGYVPIGGDV